MHDIMDILMYHHEVNNNIKAKLSCDVFILNMKQQRISLHLSLMLNIAIISQREQHTCFTDTR